MTDRPKGLPHPRPVPRESDNPIAEDYKEELLRRPSYGVHPIAGDDARVQRIEGLLAELLSRTEALERRVRDLEER